MSVDKKVRGLTTGVQMGHRTVFLWLTGKIYKITKCGQRVGGCEHHEERSCCCPSSCFFQTVSLEDRRHCSFFFPYNFLSFFSKKYPFIPPSAVFPLAMCSGT